MDDKRTRSYFISPSYIQLYMRAQGANALPMDYHYLSFMLYSPALLRVRFHTLLVIYMLLGLIELIRLGTHDYESRSYKATVLPTLPSWLDIFVYLFNKLLNIEGLIIWQVFNQLFVIMNCAISKCTKSFWTFWHFLKSRD